MVNRRSEWKNFRNTNSITGKARTLTRPQTSMVQPKLYASAGIAM